MGKRVFLGLGSNLGDSVANIHRAIEYLNSNKDLSVIQSSPFYITPPMGQIKQPDFVNAVLELNTTITPVELLEVCKSIEKLMGRQVSERWGPRLIDIDILLFGNQTIKAENLQIPHSGLSQRSFVLYPLADLDEGLQVPGLGSLKHLLEQLGESEIRRL